MPPTPPRRSLGPSHTQPVRATGSEEAALLAGASAIGPFVAWRDGPGALRVHQLAAGEPATIGRAAGNTVVIEHLLISREHAELLMRVRHQPDSTTVYLRDLRSKHGTEQRRMPTSDRDRAALALHPVASEPAGRSGLDCGDHDVLLAGEVWVRVGAVPADPGATRSRSEDVPRPTPRERDVLVELCRRQFETPDRLVATPSNAEIGARLVPAIGAARVSDIMSAMYAKYELTDTNVQNRLALAELAMRHRLVSSADYR